MNVFSVVVNAMVLAVKGMDYQPVGSKHETLTDRNIHYLLSEMFFAALAGGVTTFGTVYAIRLGASNILVSLLLALPPLLTALVSIPSGLFLRQRRNRKGWSIGSLVLHRLGLVAAALVPLLFPVHSAMWLVIVVLIFWLPLGFFDAGWNSVLADIIPEKQRASVFGRRAVLWAFGTMAASWLASLFLDQVRFPINYQIMFLVAFGASLISTYFLLRLSIPVQADQPKETELSVSSVELTNYQGIRRMLLNSFIYQISWQMPIALLSMYYIQQLHVTDGWLGTYATIGGLGIILGYTFWARVAERISFHAVIRRSALLIWVLPAAAILSKQPGILLLANFVACFAWSGAELSNIGAVLALSGEKNRPLFVSWYISTLNAALFLGPLVGAWLSGILGSITAVLTVALILRVLAAVLFNVNRVDAPVSVMPEQTALVTVAVPEIR